MGAGEEALKKSVKFPIGRNGPLGYGGVSGRTTSYGGATRASLQAGVHRNTDFPIGAACVAGVFGPLVSESPYWVYHWQSSQPIFWIVLTTTKFPIFAAQGKFTP